MRGRTSRHSDVTVRALRTMEKICSYGNAALPFALPLRMMGGLGLDRLVTRERRAAITSWSFLTGSGIKRDYCCKPFERSSHGLLVSNLSTEEICPAMPDQRRSCRLSARPNGRPRLQPPCPTLRRGRVSAGMHTAWAQGVVAGICIFASGKIRPQAGPMLVPDVGDSVRQPPTPSQPLGQ